MAHDLLGGEDAAWLHMESPTNPMVVTAVVELAGTLPLDRAYALLERVAAHPRFRAIVVEPRLGVGRPAWKEAPDFELERHFERVELPNGTEAALRAFVGRVASGLLDPDRPLWRVYLIDRPGAGTTVLFRLHHAIADGFAQLGLLASLCDDGVAAFAPPTSSAHRPVEAGVRSSAQALRRLVTLPSDPKSSLKASLGIEKRVAWSRPLALSEIKSTARALSATINDILVAVVAGALARHLARRGESTTGLEIHAVVPVNLRAGAVPTDLGNRFGLVMLGLPVGVADPVARVGAVKQRMQRLKATPEAGVAHVLLRAMGWAPRGVENAAATFFGKKNSLVLTNMPGPRKRVSLGGVPVSRMIFWVPQSAKLGLGVSIFSYAGEVTVGVMADAAVVPNPDALVGDLHAELAALQAGVRPEARV